MSSSTPSPIGRDETPLRDRADACPGALRLHSADDGGLARIRLAGGALSAAQADVLAMAADHLAGGHLDLTSRGNVQLRGLASNAGRELAVWLESSDLLPSRLHERVRNYVASPLAGLDAHGSGPVHGLLGELDRLLCESEFATRLSGRFLFGLDDGRGDIAGLAPDVTLLAQGEDDVLLSLGALTGDALRVRVTDAPRAALHAAELFLAATDRLAADRSGTGRLPAAEQGDPRVWRVRDLPPAYAPTSAALADALTARGITARPARHPAFPATNPPPPGEVQGPDGVRSLIALAPLGRLTSSALRALADAARRYGRSELRLTPWRGVVLPGVGADDAAVRLAHEGLAVDADSAWHGVGACVGRPGCAKSRADVRADAARALPPPTAGREPPSGQGVLPVYWSGCERRCGHPSGGWIDVLADGAGGYHVSVRGRPDTSAAPDDARPDEAHPDEAQQAVTPGELAAALADARARGAARAARTTRVTSATTPQTPEPASPPAAPTGVGPEPRAAETE